MNTRTYWLFNTDETEEEGEGAYRRMIRHSCIAAWGNCKGQGAEKTLMKPQSGDVVFLFCARQGIIAKGMMNDEQPFASRNIFPSGHDEYQRVVEDLEVLEHPLPVADVLKETEYALPFRHIICKLKNRAAITFLLKHFDTAQTVFAEDGDLSDKQLDQAIKTNTLRFRNDTDVQAFDKLVMARRRHGQDRLRLLSLEVYCNKCALCDVTDKALLDACHIVRWADDSKARADLRNLICLCKIHHALFDGGYIALTDKHKVLKTSNCKSEMLAQVLAMTNDFRIHDHSYYPSQKYLPKHRQRCGF